MLYIRKKRNSLKNGRGLTNPVEGDGQRELFGLVERRGKSGEVWRRNRVNGEKESVSG